MQDLSQFKEKFGTFSVSDKTYHVAANFNDLCDMEEVAGCNLLEALNNVAQTGECTAKQLRGLLASMLVTATMPDWPKDHKEQLKAAGQLIRYNTANNIAIAIAEAFYREVSPELGDKFRETMDGQAQLAAVKNDIGTEEKHDQSQEVVAPAM